jgi:hypothetical protein
MQHDDEKESFAFTNVRLIGVGKGRRLAAGTMADCYRKVLHAPSLCGFTALRQ